MLDVRDPANYDKCLEFHLREICGIFPDYIGQDRVDRRHHFKAVSTCNCLYKQDLEAQGALKDWEWLTGLLEYVVTQLAQYFFARDESHLNENDTIVFTVYLRSQLLRLRDLAKPSDADN